VCGYKVTSFKHFEGETYDADATLLVLAGNHLALPYIDKKPFVVNIVGAVSPAQVMMSLGRHPNFRGVIATSLEFFNGTKEAGGRAVLLKKKYPFCEMKPSTEETQRVSSLVVRYSEYSPRHVVNGMNAFTQFTRLQKSVTFPVDNYETAIDTEVLLASRYLVHIKYWGHVCNAVVKALALGVPVLMDAATFQVGKYAAYVNKSNGIVFPTVEDMIKYLNNTELETYVYQKLKKYCIKHASDHHLPHTTTDVRCFLEEEPSGETK